jgi:hypothetical protein
MLFEMLDRKSGRARQGRGGDRTLLAVALVLGAAVSCATPSPRPVAAPAHASTAVDFYPMEAGWRWAYDLEKDGQHMLAVYSVLERTQDTAIVQAGQERLMYAITRDGVAQKDGVSVGDFVIKNPIALGREWPVFAGTARIVAIDRQVSLPSGDYAHCLVVETVRTDPTRLARTTFAPGIGPIAIEMQVEAEGRFVTTMKANLRGTTKPGQDPLAVSGGVRPQSQPQPRAPAGQAPSGLAFR